MLRDAAGNETGELICYWDYGNFLDANAGPLIAAWDYVEATGDIAWLAQKIDRLEMVADFLVGRDVDDDGLIEAVQSGNANTLQQPARSCAWWDALNCGHTHRAERSPSTSNRFGKIARLRRSWVLGRS